MPAAGGRGDARRFHSLVLPLSLLVALAGGCRLLGPREAEVGPAPVFFPSLPEVPRIQYLASYSSARQVDRGPSLFRRFVLGDYEYGQLGKPYGVTLRDGRLFVCDTRATAVVIFDLSGRSTHLLGTKPPGQLQKPVNITVDEDGTRYVADTGLGRVMIYDALNQYRGAIGNPDSWSPTDVALDAERIYVTDVDNGRVVVLDKETHAPVLRFGRSGSGPGEMVFPTNLQLDGEGNIYVADTGNARVLKFDPQGKFVLQFGSMGRGLGHFIRPKGVAVDRNGRLYVVDAAFENVQIFDPDGRLLLFFGLPGDTPGSMNVPAKVTINYDDVGLFADRVAEGYELEYLILTTNQFGRDKVNVYGFLKSRDTARSKPVE